MCAGLPGGSTVQIGGCCSLGLVPVWPRRHGEHCRVSCHVQVMDGGCGLILGQTQTHCSVPRLYVSPGPVQGSLGGEGGKLRNNVFYSSSFGSHHDGASQNLGSPRQHALNGLERSFLVPGFTLGLWREGATEVLVGFELVTVFTCWGFPSD